MDYQEIDRIVANKDINNREIYEAFKPLVIKSIQKYCFNGQEMEELINEGLAEITYAILDYDPDRKVSFNGYLQARLKFYYLNKNKDKKHLSLNATSEKTEGREEYIDLIKSKSDPVKSIEKRMEIKRLYENIRKLPPRQQEIIYKYYLEEKDSKEIYNQLGISKSSFYKSKQKGINRLRSFYPKEEKEEIFSKFVN